MDEDFGSKAKYDCEQFRLAEYTTLHGEIRELIAESRLLERQVVFAAGAVWAWLATHSGSFPDIAWFIPLMFSIGGCVRAILLQKHVDGIADYIISSIEKKFCSGESCWHESRRPSGMRWSAHIFWGVFILITILVPAAMTVKTAS